MPQSIISTLNQPIIYSPSEDDCNCGGRDNCILIAAGQQVYSQLKIEPCGAFSTPNNTVGDELVCNGDFNLGEELVTNGTFAGSATGWTLGTNWAYETNDARATAVAVGQTLSQSVAVTVGKIYYVVYTISDYVSGDVRVTLGGANGTTRSANGTYSELLVVSAGTTLSFERFSVNFSGDIGDVSVKLAMDCWELSLSWTWNAGKACLATAPANLTQNIASIAIGLTYQLVFTISDYVAGTLTPFVGGGAGTAVSADGTYIQFITSTGANTLLDFVDAASFEGCITGISLKLLTNFWDTDEVDWIANQTGACHETGNTTDLRYSSASFTSGKYYHITITVSNATAGGINVVLGTTVLTPTTSGNGIFNFWGVSNGTELFIRPTTDFDGCISELAVDEYCNEYEFHLIRSEGDEYIVQDMTPYYILTEDVFNLTNFTFDERLAYGCYKFCLVDCCAEQQTAGTLIRNGNFADGALYWTSQNVTFSGGQAVFTAGSEASNLLEQALISTHAADCIQISFDFGNEAPFGQSMSLYIDGVLVDTEILGGGGGSYTNTFNNVPAGAVIRFVTSALDVDITLDNISVTVPEECQPLYDQCSPCINYQASFPCTKLIEAYCEGNALGFSFDDSSGNNHFKLSLRAKCDLLHPTYDQEQDDYDYSTGVTSLNFGQSRKIQSLTFYPLPEYKHDVLALEKVCDTFQIDTVDYFVIKGDYSPEWNRNTSTDLAPSRMEVKLKNQTLYNTNCG